PYWYRFTALGQQSAIGRARTAPRPNERLDALKFVYASCAHWEQGYFSAYRHMADEEPDLALFLGDYIYEYSIAARRPAEVVRPYNLEEATTLAGYRNRYALHRTDADLQLLHATAPCLATWDDHEVHDDYSGWWSKDRSVAPSSFLQRRAAAYRAFYEHMPLRRAQLGRGADMLLHRRVEFGRLASFSVLDGRQYRSRQPCDTPESGGKGQIAPASCAELADPSRTLLGFAQERWLYDGLARARAQWNVLAQNLVVAPLRTRLPPSGEAAYWTDIWDGYQSARDRLLEAIELTGPSNPVVLSGDYHSFWANELKRQSDGASVATEFVGTSVTSNGPPHDGIVSIMPENPHIRYFEGRRRGYVSAELNRERMLTRFQAISDRRDPNASVQTLQAFAVESGRGAIETA
ncbi:MAG TPA: alkaline phosphatase D family protein, partial [Verrucomicrobiae bacterium]|nr:alkaline phosphatase D family protein [Verrucomicrobiae bacterium]